MKTHHFNVQIAQELGIQKAILLNYLEFWVQSNSANNQCVFDGKSWVYHTAEAFVEIFPYFSKQIVWRLLRELEDSGYVITRHCCEDERKKSKSHLVKYYTLSEQYYELVASFKNESVSFKNESVSFKNESVSFKNESVSFKNKSVSFKNKTPINDISNLENNITRLENKKENKKELEKNSYVQTRESECDLEPVKSTDKTELSHNEQHEILASCGDFACFSSGGAGSRTQKSSKRTQEEELFDQVWQLYPRKVSRKQAYKAFKKLRLDAQGYEKLKASIAEHILSEWKGREIQHIPYLATFINQERYLDSLDTPPSRTGVSLAQQAKEIESHQAKAQNRPYDPKRAQAILHKLQAQSIRS